MEDIYLYPETETVTTPGIVPFACTNSFFTSIAQLGLDAREVILSIYDSKVFLVVPRRKSRDVPIDTVQILLQQVILSCKVADGYFVITRALRKDIRDHHRFIKHSFKLRALEGGAVECTTSNGMPYGLDGSLFMNLAAPKLQFARVMQRLLRMMDESHEVPPEFDEEEAEEETGISDELEEILAMAQSYVIAEDELEKAAAQSGMSAGYHRFTANNAYERIEKISYDFAMTDLVDGALFKRGGSVVLGLSDGETLMGTIVNVDVSGIPHTITVLFNSAFEVSLLPPAGVIAPGYNPVQREVREAVIEQLRNETAAGIKYFDAVIGSNQFSGFESKDLSELTHRLQGQKRPPNSSQMDAIVRGITVDDTLLVLGPPGTGKTTVILEWVRYFTQVERKRVLISSQNNKAVDNVLERLAEDSSIEIIRIGSEDKVQSNVRHLMFESRAEALQANIVAATTKSLADTEQASQELSAYAERLSSASETLNQLGHIDTRLSQTYQEIQVAILDPMRATYVTLLQTQNELDAIEQLVSKLMNALNDRNQRSAVLKALSWPAAMLRKQRLQGLLRKHQQLLLEEERLTNTYHTGRDALMHSLAHPALNDAKQTWHRLNADWQVQHAGLTEFPVATLPALALPEDAIPVEPSSARVTVASLQAACETRFERIELIRSSISRWTGYLNTKRNYALAQVLLESVDLVGATCVGINTQSRFESMKFDVTIIDEAGQIQVHNAMVPMSRSPKVIMLGDHLQIPPHADAQVVERCETAGIDVSLLYKSFFEYLYERFPDSNKVLLDTQYRMPAEVADLLSGWFYDGKYLSADFKQQLVSPLPQLFRRPFAIVSTSDSPNRLETSVEGKGYKNDYEAHLIAKVVQQILVRDSLLNDSRNPRFSASDLGIITPYSSQVKQIREKIRQLLPFLAAADVTDMVASLDSFQGQERPVIIYSCTRSNRRPPHIARVGFLKELRRLNVALSRPQQMLLFVGDIDFLSTCEYEQTDGFGEPVVDDEGMPMTGSSEKVFSQFITRMVDYVNAGGGEYTTSREFLARLAVAHPEETQIEYAAEYIE